MRFKQTNYNKRTVKPHIRAVTAGRHCAGFTLAEVLAALMFMAIVIPVAVQGVLVASRASVVGQRKAVAVRIAENLINEMIVSGQSQLGARNGLIEEGAAQYRWQSRLDPWSQSAAGLQPVSMQMLTVEVSFPVQGQDYSVQLSTLVSTGALL